MAEIIIAAAIGDVVSRVISLLLGRFNRRRDHEQSTEAKLDTICHMLIRARSVVEEAKGRQILNHGTLQWLSELIRIEYEGRYLLDTAAAAVRRRGDKINDDIEQDGHHGNKVSATSLFNPSKRVRLVAAGSTMRRLPSLQHGDLDREIDRVQERLRDVSAHLGEFIMLMHSCQPIIISRPLPTNILRDGQMFGRHVEKESIVNFLLHTTTTSGCCSSSGEVVGVLPIVGDKGVGKTTLVQHACDDARVRDHFAVIMLCRCTYYTTSTNGGGGRTPVFQYSKLISVGDDAGVDLNDGDALQDYFSDKRFLMAFEDVVDMNQVQMLVGFLSGIGRMSGKEGSRVIITTNSRHVAAAIGTVELVTLNFLPFPEYWFFFKAHAFAGRDAEENPRLVAAGKAIAMKLNGSSLARRP